ncbi:hypothetical protein AYI92_10730 [Shewanella xiamenensis]|nr:hypothetical protein AYI90_10525 [Shewanella xiamenensis]TVL19815.1 hypothetical protein AYI91_10705 [Shewanella xiamenensis]TVL26108.1 hypothetical protein AYI92_10730 [Shewanella xiamenensis]TVL32753.1 hypothetical protein AYI93_10760 [Shewanella xiamenensis]TVP01743.1 hypothetical protein AYI89_09745 [Shewanella xiamenensis]
MVKNCKLRKGYGVVQRNAKSRFCYAQPMEVPTGYESARFDGLNFGSASQMEAISVIKCGRWLLTGNGLAIAICLNQWQTLNSISYIYFIKLY